MNHNNHLLVGILLLTIGLVSGCASSANTPFDERAVVEMQIVNEATGTVTAFAWWRGGGRFRLGEIGGRSNRSFTIPIQADEVWMSYDILSARRVGRPAPPETFVPVRPGDRIEWTIRSTYTMFYRRLGPIL